METKTARQLSDILAEIRGALECAKLAADDMNESFFAQHNPDNKDDEWRILYDFDRNRVLSNIIVDYLNEVRRGVMQAEALFTTIDGKKEEPK